MRLRSTLLFACLAPCGSLLHAAPKVPLSAFVQESKFSMPRLSPDGKYIALTVRTLGADGHYARAVTIFSLPEMNIAGEIRIPKFNVPTRYFFTSPTRLLITTALEKGAPEQPSNYVEIVASEIDASKQKYLYGYGTTFAGRRGAPAGQMWTSGYVTEFNQPNNHFLLGVMPYDEHRTYLFDVDSLSGSQNRVASVPGRGLGFLLQANDKPRIAFGVGTDGEPVVYHYDERGGSWDRQKGKLGKFYLPRQLSADGNELVALHSADGGPLQLIKETLATDARTTLSADPRGNVLAATGVARAGLPFGAVSFSGVPAMHYLDGGNEDDKQLHKTLSAQFPGSYINFVDAARDGRTVLFRVTSDRQPGEYYVLYRDTMKADLLYSVHPAIVPQDMAQHRPIAFKARDGLDLYGFLTLPQRANGAKLPLLVLPHGGSAPGGSNDWFFDRDAQFLASRGYAVLQVNFRGSSGRGMNFEQAGYRQWGAKIQDDLVDAIKWTIAQGDVDGDRVCAFGAGFGAYSALMLAAREPALIKCAVGQGGFYDLNLLYKSEVPEREEKVETMYDKQIGRDKGELARFSPLTLADRITAPVLLVHGEKNKVAPISHATAMRAALVKAGRAPEWLVAPDEGDDFEKPANVTLFYQKLEAFLDKNIGH